MSYLHETVAKGMEHRFTVPIEAMAGFEEMFNQGSVAFRIALDSEMSSNRLTWANPKLVVRYFEDVEKNNMPPLPPLGMIGARSPELRSFWMDHQAVILR